MKRYLPVILFALVWLGLRVFWLDGDPGIAAAWEYGYNATDEGYYLCGGKEKLLWGCFVDMPRCEAFTYGFSAGTHWLSYLAHRVFGLSTWTWRIPFVLIAFVAWLSAFAYLEKKSGALNALLLCLAFSSIPMTIAYERTASNDVLIGSLAVLAYVTAAGKGRWRIFATAVLTGMIILVKPSVWVLLPVVAAGVLRTPKFRAWWIDVLAYAVATVFCIFICRMLVVWSVLPDAERAGITAWEVVRRTTTHYPLPDIFDFASHFKGLSAFPRDPSYAMLGVSAVFVFVLPIAMALRNLTKLRFNGHTLLFVAIPAYIAAVNVMNTQYTHYFIPVLMFLPILLDAVGEELAVDGVVEVRQWRRQLFVFGAVAFTSAVGCVVLADWTMPPRLAQSCYSQVYNFPQNNVWSATYPAIIVFCLAAVGTLVYLRGFREARRYGAAWASSAFFAASVVFAAVPALRLAPFLKMSAETFFAPMAVSLFTAVVLLVMIFGFPECMPWKRLLPVASGIAIVCCYLFTPNWRDAAAQLLSAPTHHHQLAAEELRKLLPENAIVIGERSNQMLMSLPIRTATTFAANSDPIPVIESILAVEPDAELYALADSQHVYNLKHYKEHEKEYALHLMKSFKMPSFGTGKLADVYLCRIVPVGAARN